MVGRAAAYLAAGLIVAQAGPAAGQGRGHGGHHGSGGFPLGGVSGARVGVPGCPPTINYAPHVRLIGTPGGFVPYAPPLIVVGPGGGFLAPPVSLAPVLPPPVLPDLIVSPPEWAPVRPGPLPQARTARPRDEEKAGQFVTLGDRMFRAGNLAKAVARYGQALQADPGQATARVRLSQVALRRDDYREAAERLREAQAADPGWLVTPADIQALYPEPAQFRATVAKLEAHLQAHPEDRDAWLVLGAQWYLSGRTRQAADIFLRLTDRAPDPTLAAFLKASRVVE